MKFTIITAAACCLTLVTAQDMNVEQIISAYLPGATLSLEPSVSTRLASAINSVASTWYESPQLTSLNSAILSAAPTAEASVYATGGIPYGLVAEESWYSSGVPSSLQTVLSSQFAALSSVEWQILAPLMTTSSVSGAQETSTTTSSHNAAMRTAAPVMVVGAVVGAMAAL